MITGRNESKTSTNHIGSCECKCNLLGTKWKFKSLVEQR